MPVKGEIQVKEIIMKQVRNYEGTNCPERDVVAFVDEIMADTVRDFDCLRMNRSLIIYALHITRI